MDDFKDWAQDVFGGAELGDVRRTTRLVCMAAKAVRQPSGRLSEVYESPAERQGAYDFIESPHIDAKAIGLAMAESTARRCAAYDWVYVPLDGTSIKLWDGTGGRKDFGAIGTYTSGATGLKLDNALAVTPDGVPVGVAAQVWWSRPRKRAKKRRPSYKEPLEKKETQHLIACIDQVIAAFGKHAPNTKCWFQMDRGCDAQYVLLHLASSGHFFTVRSQAMRRMITVGNRRVWVKTSLRKEPRLGQFTLDLPETESRAARRATLSVRAKRVTLQMRDKWTGKRFEMTTNVVLVQEEGCRVDKVDWLLITNQPIATYDEVMAVVRGYAQRWRIEEFHKTWKSGACNVEDTQLHRSERVIRWATLLAAVAARIERLKRLARSSPDLDASEELSPSEIEALVLLKRRRKTAKESVPDEPTIAVATQWIAELGGYTGKSSGGPPGSIIIARGLERLAIAAEIIELAKLR
jgi:Transposase DNA-binding/Transposase DDE domain